MKKISSLGISVIFLFFSCNLAQSQLQFESAFPNLTFQQPVDIQNAGDGSNRIFVSEQRGVISVFLNSQNTTSIKTFLDISDKVLSGGELGLLGLAFHPDYKDNGYFFVDYTTDNPRRTIISRFKVSATDPDMAERNSEVILLEINQPYSNHNGGQISFGPDGYLYISLGDGGSAGDPQNNAQNLSSPLGKILRIDINKKSGSLNYAIPPDNPFKGNSSGYREEIFAYGLRNVWRFSFDFSTNKIWAADVGQNAWEEIDLIEKGGNYGWRCYEGNHSYNTSGCTANNYIKPIWEYGHNSDGGLSITGGFIYKGKNASELLGKYIYADYVSGKIWSLELNGSTVNNTFIFASAGSISTFGQDENKELYFANYANGKIYKFKGTPVTKVGKADLPLELQLEQNYPNPFNPETVIGYQLAVNSFVTLNIYDVLGKEIATLVHEEQKAGFYNVRFDSEQTTNNSPLSTGIYFYTLMIPGFTQTKKMILLK